VLAERASGGEDDDQLPDGATSAQTDSRTTAKGERSSTPSRASVTTVPEVRSPPVNTIVSRSANMPNARRRNVTGRGTAASVRRSEPASSVITGAAMVPSSAPVVFASRSSTSNRR